MLFKKKLLQIAIYIQIAITIFLTFDMSVEPEYVLCNTHIIEEQELEFVKQILKSLTPKQLRFLNGLGGGEEFPGFIRYTNGEYSYTLKISACYDFLKEAEEVQEKVEKFVLSGKTNVSTLYYKTKKKLLNFVDNIYDIFYYIEWKKLDTENTIEDLCKIQIKIPIQEIEDIVREFVDISKLNELMERSLRVFMEENLFYNPNIEKKYWISYNNTPIDSTPSSCSKDTDEIKKEEKEFTKNTSDEYGVPDLLHAFKIRSEPIYVSDEYNDSIFLDLLKHTSDPIHVSDGKFQNDLDA